MFGEIAPKYDFLNHLFSLGIDRSWRRRLVRLVPPNGDGPILDCCTGTGDLALNYWRASREPTPVIGVDFCRPMLAIGREKVYHAGASHRVRLVEGDALRMPFPSDLFQIVCVAFGLRNMADTDAGLRELVRVCRRGGSVAVLEFSTPQQWPIRGVYGFYFNRVLPRVGQQLAPSSERAYNYLPASVNPFPQAEALAERMLAAGLARVEFRRFTLGVATLYIGRK